jgi:hypothetical protein
MSAYQQKPNTGTLFKNTKKTSPNHPDMDGIFMNENGVLRRIAAWTKEGKNGRFLSFIMSDMDQPRNNEKPVPPPTASDDGLPF